MVSQEEYKYTREGTAWERSAWELGLVFVNEFQKAEPDSSRLWSSHPEPFQRQRCHIHFFIVLRFPPWLLSPSFAARRVCHVVFWKELSSGRGRACADTPGSHDLLPFLLTRCLLTAHSRKEVQPGQGQSRPCPLSAVLHGRAELCPSSLNFVLP